MSTRMTEEDMIYGENGWNTARAIRQVFGLPSFWRMAEEFEDYEWPYPSLILHEDPADVYDHTGGTNLLAVGEKDSGKSTLALELARLVMETNDEAVIWRGASSRSEWLPYAPWTTLLLPANADVEPRWQHRDIGKDLGGDPAQLSEVVNEVRYYDDPHDCLAQLEPHTFHVVYPDPSFAGCTEIMEQSSYSPHDVRYVTGSEAAEDEHLKRTPTVHWWVALMVARVESGPYDWTTLLFDEAADLAPDSARADRAQTYEKVVALRHVMADTRKYRFSPFFFAHHEENLHSKVRRTIQWRISMPDGTANPCNNHNDRPPVGFNSIPIHHDLISSQPVGRGLCWTETNWTRFNWKDISVDAEDLRLDAEDRWLKISVSDTAPDSDSFRARGTEPERHQGGVGD